MQTYRITCFSSRAKFNISATYHPGCLERLGSGLCGKHFGRDLMGWVEDLLWFGCHRYSSCSRSLVNVLRHSNVVSAVTNSVQRRCAAQAQAR